MRIISALNASNSIIVRVLDAGYIVTPMKLQRMLYFVYKKYIQTSHAPLFAERFEAWQRGPVVAAVYRQFKNYVDRPIKNLGADSDGTERIVNVSVNSAFIESFDFVCGKYMVYNGIQLSELTRKSGTAWDKVKGNNWLYLIDDDIAAEEWFDVG
jgi:uncharacterized phage-associated protein